MELLVVMAIIGLLAALVAPAFNAIKGAGDLTKSASDISGVLEQARSYAMANNTYVYFGIKEVDSFKDDLTDGKGRVAVAVVASATGTRPYGQTPASLPDDKDKIKSVSRLQKFDNVHLADSVGTGGGLGTRETTDVIDLGSKSAVTSFKWPVAGGGSDFSKVIEFDPQGVARVQSTAADSDKINGWIEIPLQPSHANSGPGSAEKNAAVIQVDGMTGSVRIYRP